MNAFQASAKTAFAQVWQTATIKVVAMDATYVYSAAHDFLSDVPGGTRVAVSAALTGKTSTGGRLDADNFSFGALPIGDTITQLFAFVDTGVEASSLLVIYYDTAADTTPISIETTGGVVDVEWQAVGLGDI